MPRTARPVRWAAAKTFSKVSVASARQSAMGMIGLPVGPARAPVGPMSEPARAQLHAALDQAGLRGDEVALLCISAPMTPDAVHHRQVSFAAGGGVFGEVQVNAVFKESFQRANSVRAET